MVGNVKSLKAKLVKYEAMFQKLLSRTFKASIILCMTMLSLVKMFFTVALCVGKILGTQDTSKKGIYKNTNGFRFFGHFSINFAIQYMGV